MRARRTDRAARCSNNPVSSIGAAPPSPSGKKKEYDFSQGTRGKFYKRGARLSLPVYLDEHNRVFVERIARKRKTDVSAVVNELLKGDGELAKAMR